MPTYAPASDETKQLLNAILFRYKDAFPIHWRCTFDEENPDIMRKIVGQYQEIIDERVRIELLMAYGDRDADGNLTNNALNLHGNPCLGICSVVSLEHRSRGLGDVLIKLDGDWWEGGKDVTQQKRIALLDHELFHIDFKRNDGTTPKRDALGRPMIRMRRHTVDVGWFAQIAHRHGSASPEQIQAKQIWDEYGQFLFPGLVGDVDDHVEFDEELERIVMEDAGVRAFREEMEKMGEGSSVTITGGGKTVKIDGKGVRKGDA